ncbi:hypothetical protein Poli38472_011293 [Pythium oligandrum]|uniref:Ubiquitin-like protease family profile domain-containing protein n=1 Tax=Pythium oligandrum TaxID=41045 RepID=A0A8K1CSU7_PYTOL|nr:hypothetical protein Poli38472_011293 [Pythium oligandrum]|eukprot:TMW67673.1 hypothetical protein Poli38472_011293 [Pythium oligandrum]
MVHQVLNYHDVQLYDTDVGLFTTCQWLNDNAINFYFQYLYHTLCLPAAGAQTSDVLFVDPAIVSCMMLQCDEDDEYADLGRGMQVETKRICFLPVNDNESFDGESSHWSLLVYHAERQRFQHYDSSSGHNTTAAKRIAKTFLQLLQASGVEHVQEWQKESFENVRDAPQQRNGYDCGMYVLLVAEYLCRQYLKAHPSSQSLLEWVTPDRVTQKRLEIPQIVQRLQQPSA